MGRSVHVLRLLGDRRLVEEQDLKAAIQVLNRTRKAAEAATASPGQASDTVDGT